MLPHNYEDIIESSEIWQDLFVPTIRANLPKLTNSRVYELAYGSGFCFRILCSVGFTEYVGVDICHNFREQLLRVAENVGAAHKVQFIHADAFCNFDKKLGVFDFVISTCCLTGDSYEMLLRFCKHLYDACEDQGTVLVSNPHNDRVWTKEVIEAGQIKYGFRFLSPIPKIGESFKSFTPVTAEVGPPSFKQRYVLKGHTLSRKDFVKAMKEVGFKNVDVLKIVSTAGREDLLDSIDVFGWCFFLCTK